MAGTLRNYLLSGAFLLAVAIVAVAAGSGLWACVAATVLALAGVVLFRGNGWRTGSLVAAALALSLALLDLFAGFLSPNAMNAGLVQRTEPAHWPPPNPVVGFRPLPDSTARAIATFDGKVIYDRTYHFDSTAARVTPPAGPNADTYLFFGDSFVFGQGMVDDETLASQFAKLNGPGVHAVNLGVPGYGPNHLVRALEAGLLDRYRTANVKAVVTWMIPAHLARVTGDGTWLGSSPRYVLENGKPVFTGTFDEHRWRDPLEGLRYLLAEQFAFVAAIGQKQRQAYQIELYVALMARLSELVREKFGVPLVVVYSWPDEGTQQNYGADGVDLSVLVDTLKRVRELGDPVISVDRLTQRMEAARIMIPHDGHPTAFVYGMLAEKLTQELVKR